MSPYLAASTSIVFAGAETSRPSIVNVMMVDLGARHLDVPGSRRRAGPAAVAVTCPTQPRPVALARRLDVRLDSGRNHMIIDAIGIAIASPSTHRQLPMIWSQIETMMSRSIGVASPQSMALEHLHGPVGALAARRALAARLVAVELRGLERDVDDRTESSTTMIAPEPSIEPAFASESKS